MPRQRPPVLAQQTYRQHRRDLQPLSLAEKFRFIHRTNMWGNPASTSGVGSSWETTTAIRDGIAEICREFNVRSLLDAPCGDAGWITTADLPIARYIGVDIVPELIEQDGQRLVRNDSQPTFEFHVADLTRDALPYCDMILCRDCLVHLSFANISQALENFRKSGSRLLLTTTFPDQDTNSDIEDGDWRLLNLQKPPFCFPAPLRVINEQCDEIGGAYRDKSLALWELAILPTLRD